MSPAATLSDDGWITLPTTPQKRHQKETAEAWIDRLLGIPTTDFRAFRLGEGDVVEVRSAQGAHEPRALAATRVAVLRSLVRRAREPAIRGDWRRSDGGGVVLCDEERGTFLLTRKDGLHPNPRCRGRLALVSGSVEVGESFAEGALRELYEEVRDLALADAAAARIRSLGTPTLAAVQWPGDYRFGVLVAAGPEPLFARWREAWAREEVLSEASPICLDRAALLAAMDEEKSLPGSRFVASHHEALRLALGAPSP
jgi:hypothetical protein